MSQKFYRGIDLNNTAIELVVEDDMITAVRPIAADSSLPWLLPSLVDLQHNGALEIAYNNLAENAPAQLRQVAEHLIRNGIGRCLATFTTCPYERLNTAAKAFDQALCAEKILEALFPGIFHEGVFISPKAGWRGGHDPAYILPPDWEKFSRLQELADGRIRLVNIAPEEPGALDFIRKAHAAGIKVALGHCCPDTATIAAAVKAGASMVTHFGNGSSPEIHRFHNPFWGFLDQAGLALGLVGDGFHLPPELVRVALRCKGIDNCFMVSDANIYSGCIPGTYQRIGGLDCVIEKNGFIHVVGQEILAGAWYQNNRSVEFLVNQVGLNFLDAWKLCSTIPAKLIGIDLPQLQPGDEATFVQARFDKQTLHIEQSVFCGKNHLD
jgi:N-acetylglucosamine-6-phosphate deacetylase